MCSKLNVLIIIIFSVVTFSHITHCQYAPQQSPYPEVTVEQGKVAEVTYTIPRSRRVVNAFYGIPYAAPPINEYRYKPPQPPIPWAGVYNASTFGSHCLQWNPYSHMVIGEDDCLYLNVYTPVLPLRGIGRLMNVIVDIHGGAFMGLDGDINSPDYLLNYTDIILVTLNYRLGAIGFFSTGDEVVPGNNGLKDQVAALKWVQRNIIRFGGDPDKVTITGCSAGGASVNYHYLSPLSKGLFQRGISFSGSVFPRWTLPRDVQYKSMKLARLLGCPIDSSRRMIMCMQTRPAIQIGIATQFFYPWRSNPFSPFGPVIEPKLPGAFITKQPLQLLLDKEFHDLPWMTNVCQDEGLYPTAAFIEKQDVLEELDKNWLAIAPLFLDYDYVRETSRRDSISSAIRQFYFQNKKISKKTTRELVKMAGDRFFFIPIRHAAKIYTSVATYPVYSYKFSYRGRYSVSNGFTHNLNNYGVSHADDQQYIWGGRNGPHNDSRDFAVANFMVPLIVNFAKTGKPFVRNIEWPPVSEDEMKCLKISSDREQEVMSCEDPNVDKFWKSVLPEEYPYIRCNTENAA